MYSSKLGIVDHLKTLVLHLGIIKHRRQIPAHWKVQDVEVTDITDGYSISMTTWHCVDNLPFLSVAHGEVRTLKVSASDKENFDFSYSSPSSNNSELVM